MTSSPSITYKLLLDTPWNFKECLHVFWTMFKEFEKCFSKVGFWPYDQPILEKLPRRCFPKSAGHMTKMRFSKFFGISRF